MCNYPLAIASRSAVPKRLEIDDELMDRLRVHCPKYLSPTGFANLLIDQGLTGGATVPAYCVGAGNQKELGSTPKAQLTNEASSSRKLASEESENSLVFPHSVVSFLGDGVGKGESERETPRKPPSFFKHIPDDLLPLSELIHDFWRVKKGSKGQVAWKLLMTGLTKIRDAYGEKVTEEQLQLAINGKWQGITLERYEQFKPKAAPGESLHRHPASQVYTAKDFDLEPASNSVIEDLF